jgi:hypothetical protein
MTMTTRTAAAHGRRRRVFEVDEDRAIEALRLAWGDAYDIGFADGAWRACRHDGDGSVLTGRMPDELNAAMRADWSGAGRP